MDEALFLRNSFGSAIELNKINNDLIEWDYTEVIGESCYQKYTGHFGYVKLKISLSEDSFSHQFLNNVSQKELPVPYLKEIMESLNFFIPYLQGIKGERKNLNFELLDGTYHQIDSQRMDFQRTTFFAICNCFDKNLHTISENERQIIKNCKTQNSL